MNKIISISIALFFNICLFGQITIDDDQILRSIEKQLPTNWKMEINGPDIHINYKFEVLGVFKNESPDEERIYHANTHAKTLSDTLKISKVSFILYEGMPLLSQKEVTKNQKHNNNIFQQSEDLADKMNIKRRPGKGGPKSMLDFKSEEEELEYYNKLDQLDEQYKAEPSYYSEKYSFDYIFTPYLGVDIKWDDKTVQTDVNQIHQLLKKELHTYD